MVQDNSKEEHISC